MFHEISLERDRGNFNLPFFIIQEKNSYSDTYFKRYNSLSQGKIFNR